MRRRLAGIVLVIAGIAGAVAPSAAHADTSWGLLGDSASEDGGQSDDGGQ